MVFVVKFKNCDKEETKYIIIYSFDFKIQTKIQNKIKSNHLFTNGNNNYCHDLLLLLFLYADPVVALVIVVVVDVTPTPPPI